MSSLRKMLPSFRSLWMTLLLCRYWTPLSSWHDEDEVVVFEKALETDDVGVVQALVNGDLGGHLLPLVLLQDQRLGHDFPGENLVRLSVRDFVALGETTFAEEPSPRVPFHGARVHQNIRDFFERSRFGVDIPPLACARKKSLAVINPQLGDPSPPSVTSVQEQPADPALAPVVMGWFQPTTRTRNWLLSYLMQHLGFNMMLFQAIGPMRLYNRVTCLRDTMNMVVMTTLMRIQTILRNLPLYLLVTAIFGVEGVRLF
ncbi:hypothetical protein EYF80_046155 [Liparis tanakae]|uniref:Uncharacterized protein n=1 Tax=Liparis tanakae TaxID=230148 RepID=A0A4Z2FRV7_9TELE|nr:hypothetical protein EYF80_046155 [Liparis tanakae]